MQTVSIWHKVHEINICDYTQEQAISLGVENMSYETWLEKLQTKLTRVVESVIVDLDNRIWTLIVSTAITNTNGWALVPGSWITSKKNC